MNKDHYLIDLSESERTDFGRVEFADQSEEQKIFSAIWALESQVNNGGFEQYFASWDGETATFAPTALQRIGANQCAHIVERALRVVSQQQLPVDQAGRQKVIDSLSDIDREKLRALDDEFFAYPDNLSNRLFDFVKSHPAVFGPIE
jgi:hypothetical protein